MKKLVALLLSLVLAVGIFLPNITLAAEISVSIDGQPVVFEGQRPIIIDGRTLVPVRGVFEALGFEVDWDIDVQRATLYRSDYTVEIYIGRNSFYTNGIAHELDVPAQLVEGRTLLPIRAVVESVGYRVDWDDTTHTVIVHTTPDALQERVAIGVAAGDGHSMVIMNDNSLWAWGWNDFGQVGSGSILAQDQQRPLQVMENIATVSGGFGHTVALTNNGVLWTWGFNTDGQIGDGTWNHRIAPFRAMENVVYAVAGCQHTMAITTEGVLYGWGSNMYGQVGVPRQEGGHQAAGLFYSRPVRVMENVVAVSAGFSHTMAINAEGVLYGWGNNRANQVNGESVRYHHTPVRIMEDVIAVSAGGGFTFAITSDGTLWGWGANFNGFVGDGTTTNRLSPVPVMENVVAVSSARTHTMAVTESGVLYGWGMNNVGQLGDGTTVNRHSPVQIMENVAGVAATIFHTMAITESGEAWAWGGNMVYQLGDGSAVDRHYPMRVYFE